jgi:hypothetical protein
MFRLIVVLCFVFLLLCLLYLVQAEADNIVNYEEDTLKQNAPIKTRLVRNFLSYLAGVKVCFLLLLWLLGFLIGLLFVLLLLGVGLRSFALVVFVVCLWFVAGCFVGLVLVFCLLFRLFFLFLVAVDLLW